MDYRERRAHGEEGMPVAFYPVVPDSIRYRMNCHWHPEHEIIAVRSGWLELRIGDESRTMRTGDVAFIQGGTLHSAVPHECRYDCFVLDPVRMLSSEDACADVLHQIADGKLRVDPCFGNGHPEFYEICERLSTILAERRDGFAFFAKGLIFEFFGYLLRFHLYQSQIDLPQTEKNDVRMKRVLDFIQRNYSREIGLNELAVLADMNPNYFCRYFRSLTRQTPIEYLITYRLECARYALRSTDLAVTDVAFSCGFNDVSHFIKMFRKTYGVTPKAYRTAQTHPEQRKATAQTPR